MITVRRPGARPAAHLVREGDQVCRTRPSAGEERSESSTQGAPRMPEPSASEAQA
ncbi:hypothetical protein ABIA39_000743 [Nocardia sp. GAS34]